MRAVIFHRHDDIRIEDLPIPSIGAGEVLLRVAGCGLCGSDILKITGAADPPVSLGHELTGSVVASESADLMPGQRVVVAHHVPCGVCPLCVGGSPTMCAQFTSSQLDPCGLAEYVRVPAAHVRQVMLPLPDLLSDEDASFTEPLACCLRAIGRAHLDTVATAAIVGLGSMGLLMAQALRAVRPGLRVLGMDPLAERRLLALDQGMTDTFAPDAACDAVAQDAASGQGVDLVVLTAGAPSALDAARRLVRAGGEVLLFAAPMTNHENFALWDWYRHELRLTASYSSTPADLRQALDLLVTGQVRVPQLISHRLPLHAFHAGVALARTHQALKVYFEIGA